MTNCLKALRFKRFQFQSQTRRWNTSQRCRESDYLLFSHSQTQNIVNYTLRFLLLLLPFYHGAKLVCVKWLQGAGNFFSQSGQKWWEKYRFSHGNLVSHDVPLTFPYVDASVVSFTVMMLPKDQQQNILCSSVLKHLRVLHLKLVTETSKFNKKETIEFTKKVVTLLFE